MSEGRRGAVAPIYATLHAAEAAGVAPWDLEAQPIFWQAHILERQRVLAEARQAVEQRARRVGALQGRRR